MTCWAAGALAGSEEPPQTPGDLSAAADRSEVAPCLDLEICHVRLHFLLLQAQLGEVLAQPASPAHHSPPSLLDHLGLSREVSALQDPAAVFGYRLKHVELSTCPAC